MDANKVLTADLDDIIFENRNQSYGAYQIRKGYNQTMQRSMLASMALLVTFFVMSCLLQNTTQAEEVCEDNETILTITEVTLPPKPALPTPPPKAPKTEPAKAVMSRPTKKYVATIIVPDKVIIKDDEKMPEQSEFKNVEAAQKTVAGNPSGIAATANPDGDTNTLMTDKPSVSDKKHDDIKATEHPTNSEPLVVVEQYPEFGNGISDLVQYLSKNIRYPQMAQEMGIEGKVFVQFVVEKDGSISDVKAVRGPEGGLKEEAVRVVSQMPKWKPGRQQGTAVRVRYTLPVAFKLAQ